MFNPQRDAAYFNAVSEGHLPGLLGMNVTEVKEGRLEAEIAVRPDLFAPNGFLHAGTIVSLADSAAGYATIAHLPEGAKSFTTLELKTNFTGACRAGMLKAIAEVEHLGRTTQVWGVGMWAKEQEKRVALFRCTQLILY